VSAVNVPIFAWPSVAETLSRNEGSRNWNPDVVGIGGAAGVRSGGATSNSSNALRPTPPTGEAVGGVGDSVALSIRPISPRPSPAGGATPNSSKAERPSVALSIRPISPRAAGAGRSVALSSCPNSPSFSSSGNVTPNSWKAVGAMLVFLKSDPSRASYPNALGLPKGWRGVGAVLSALGLGQRSAQRSGRRTIRSRGDLGGRQHLPQGSHRQFRCHLDLCSFAHGEGIL